MKDLKQLWLISIDVNKLEDNGATLKMQNGSVKVKQLGHFIESARNGGYRNSARSSDRDVIKSIMNSDKYLFLVIY